LNKFYLIFFAVFGTRYPGDTLTIVEKNAVKTLISWEHRNKLRFAANS